MPSTEKPINNEWLSFSSWPVKIAPSDKSSPFNKSLQCPERFDRLTAQLVEGLRLTNLHHNQLKNYPSVLMSESLTNLFKNIFGTVRKFCQGAFIFAAGLYLLFSCTYAHGLENKRLKFNMPRPDFNINSPKQTVPVFNRQFNFRPAPSKPYELQKNKITGQTEEWEKASTFFYEMFMGIQEPRDLLKRKLNSR